MPGVLPRCLVGEVLFRPPLYSIPFGVGPIDLSGFFALLVSAGEELNVQVREINRISASSFMRIQIGYPIASSSGYALENRRNVRRGLGGY